MYTQGVTRPSGSRHAYVRPAPHPPRYFAITRALPSEAGAVLPGGTEDSYGYTPPEVLTGKPGPEHDQYSLAAVVFRCVTGRRLFPHDPYDAESERAVDGLDFLAKAPKHVVEREKQRSRELTEQIETITRNLEDLPESG